MFSLVTSPLLGMVRIKKWGGLTPVGAQGRLHLGCRAGPSVFIEPGAHGKRPVWLQQVHRHARQTWKCCPIIPECSRAFKTPFKLVLWASTVLLSPPPPLASAPSSVSCISHTSSDLTSTSAAHFLRIQMACVKKLVGREKLSDGVTKKPVERRVVCFLFVCVCVCACKSGAPLAC